LQFYLIELSKYVGVHSPRSSKIHFIPIVPAIFLNYQSPGMFTKTKTFQKLITLGLNKIELFFKNKEAKSFLSRTRLL